MSSVLHSLPHENCITIVSICLFSSILWSLSRTSYNDHYYKVNSVLYRTNDLSKCQIVVLVVVDVIGNDIFPREIERNNHHYLSTQSDSKMYAGESICFSCLIIVSTIKYSVSLIVDYVCVCVRLHNDYNFAGKFR